MIFGLFVAMRIYNLDKNLFLYKITACSAVCCAIVSFVEYELSRETSYEIALQLSSIHTMMNSLTIFIAVVSIWTFTRPFPKEKYPYLTKILFFINLAGISILWGAELTGSHIITRIDNSIGIWQYEVATDRLMVKFFIFWYAIQALSAIFSLYRFYNTRASGKLHTWALKTVLFGSALFAAMFFLFVFNNAEVSKGTYISSPIILLCIAFFAHTYTNFKLFTVSPINAFDNILDSMSNAMAIADLNFKISYLNKSSKKEFGILNTQIPEMTFDSIAQSFKVKGWERDAQLIKSLPKGEKYAREFRFTHRDHTLFFHMTFSPIFNTNQIKTGYLVIATNITKLKQSEAELKKSNTKLKQSNTELERFAYIASHDLKTPLRNVTSFLNLIQLRIQRNYNDPTIEEYLEFAVNGARQMNQLIVDVLEFSKLGPENTTTSKLVRLNDCIRLAIQNLKPFIEAKNAKVKIDHLPQIIADDSRMLQLFQNLIENGIKYNESATPEVTIRCTEQHNTYHIIIEDNGIGFREEYSTQIFEMFRRLHTTSEYTGTGIGLAICKKIVLELGGHIRVNSVEGTGSSFTIELPKTIVQKSTPILT